MARWQHSRWSSLLLALKGPCLNQRRCRCHALASRAGISRRHTCQRPCAGTKRRSHAANTVATVLFGGNEAGEAILLRFLPDGGGRALRNPTVQRPSRTNLVLNYRVTGPGGIDLAVERDVSQRAQRDGTALVETFKLTSSRPLMTDVEIEIPFLLQPAAPRTARATASPSSSCSAVFPLKNGWAKSQPLTPAGVQAEYRLGQAMTGKDTQQLALPLAHVAGEGWQSAVCADPTFSALFTLRLEQDGVKGSLRYRYAASRVPLEATETRAFAVWLPAGKKTAAFEAAVDAFFRLMLPDVPPGPAWLHEIAMVGYDFLSDDGQGWERDVRELARWLKPAERRRVAFCLHGWYDALGSYCYDAANQRMKEEWTAFERTRKVKLTPAELKRRLRLARDLGFRVLLYFADGLAADSGVPGYRDDWAYRDAKGNKITGWQGPDTFGTTYLLNPAHPEVFRWYTGYLEALLRTYGAELDGVVWDETFHARIGQIAAQPDPAYCDRAMFALVKALTKQVEKFDPQKVFLASDCIGVAGWDDVPGYGMVADGTYQDSHCDPPAWSYGLFPNLRTSFWSCNWGAMSDFHLTRWGVEKFGVPVAISNGWGDDRGPSEWRPWERERNLKLFRERLQRKDRVRFLREDPAKLLAQTPDRPAAGDAIPEPAPRAK